MLPFALLAYDQWLRPDAPAVKRRRFWFLHAPVLSLIAAAGCLRFWLYLVVEHPGAARAPGHALLLQAYILVRYLLLLLMPVGQTIVPVVSPIFFLADARVVAGIAGTAVVATVIVLARRRAPLVSFGLLWFVLMLVPSSALTLLSEFGQPMSEHRTYIASFGFFIAAGWAVAAAAGGAAQTNRLRPRAAAGLLGLALAALLAATIARNRVWASPVTLWADAEKKAPGIWLAVNGLADAKRQADDCAGALEDYEHAIVLQPQKGESYLGAAWCEMQLGQATRAAETLRLGIARAPESTQMRLQLAALEVSYFGRPEEALRICREAVALAPGLADARACVERNERALANRRR